MNPKYIYERFGYPMLFGADKTTGVGIVFMEGSESSIEVHCNTSHDAEKVRAKLQELVDFISEMAVAFDEASPEEFSKFYYITSKGWET